MSVRSTYVRALSCAILVAGVCACAARAPGPLPGGAVATRADAARGHLLIVGGGPQPAEVVRRFVELAGGAGSARIIVLPMASAAGAENGEEKARDLRALGAEASSLDLSREQANSDSIARLFRDATGIWFGGGDQSRLMAAIGGTKVDSAIAARYRAGAVVGGTSAGAAVMSSPMITGGERRPGGSRPPSDTTTPAFMTIERDNVVTAEGLGLLGGAIIDQHFLRRRRHNRLITLVLERPPHLGVGIDESTALVVHPDGHWEVIGSSAVVVYDARRSAVTPSGAPALGAAGVIMHVLPAGSRYDPGTGRATLPRAGAEATDPADGNAGARRAARGGAESLLDAVRSRGLM